MRIGELGQASGVATKTIRFYEGAGLLPQPERGSSGYRDYDISALPRLRFIRSAQACGLTLAQIRQIIAVRNDGGIPCEHVIGLLDTHATQLDKRITELTHLRAEIGRLRERATSMDPASCSAEDVCHLIPRAPA